MRLFFIVLCAALPAALFLLFFVLNRGKLKGSRIGFDLAYGLSIGVSMILVSYNRWVAGDLSFALLLWIIPAALMAPYLGSTWLSAAKGRESPARALLLSLALLLFFSSIFFDPVPAIALDAPGFVFLALFFRDIYRYPYLSEGWLSEAIESSAREAGKPGRYSSKPVVIPMALGRRFSAGSFDFSILAKDHSVVCRIGRARHRKLGSPRLDEFFSILCARIAAEINRPARSA